MMTKTDYEVVGNALVSLPMGARMVAYRRLVRSLSARNPDFDAYKFGKCMGIPPLFRITNKK